MWKIYLSVISISLLFSGFVQADTATPISQQKEVQSTFKDMTGFDLSGHIDTSYNYLLRSNHFIGGNYSRELDLEPNGFTLQQAMITIIKRPPQGLGGGIELILGRDANTFASYGMNPNFGIQNIGFTIQQAFLQYSKNANTVMGGKFATFTGAESYDATKNTNFSHSFLDTYAQPGTLLGIRDIYVVNNALSLAAGVNNGWDNIRDTSRRKTLELNMTYTPNSVFSMVISGYSGQQRATDFVSTGPVGTRSLIDLVTELNLSEKLSFVVDYDYGLQTKAELPDETFAKAVWQGIAGYINYKFNDRWQTSFRGEIFNDSNGFRTGVRQNLRELTFTVGYSPIQSLLFRAETRHDFSNVSSFVNANGVSTSNNQQSYALEVLFMFS